ncbi:MAG: hypothetical protein AB7U83_24600 [Vicinamibacterales bacterium]
MVQSLFGKSGDALFIGEEDRDHPIGMKSLDQVDLAELFPKDGALAAT